MSDLTLKLPPLSRNNAQFKKMEIVLLSIGSIIQKFFALLFLETSFLIFFLRMECEMQDVFQRKRMKILFCITF